MKQLKGDLKSIFAKGSFVQNVSFVSLGKLIVLIISFVFVPILSRIYSSEAYGNFTLYDSICNTASMVVLLGYPNAYVLIEGKKSFKNLVIFQLLSLVFASVLSLVVMRIFFWNDLSIFIPIGIFVNGAVLVFANWMIRNQDYKISSIFESSSGLLIRASNLIIGLTKAGNAFGLILGNVFGRGVFVVINFFRFFRHQTRIDHDFLKDVKSTLLSWKRYPLYFLPNQLVGQLGGQIIVFFLAAVFDNGQLGYFSMSQTLFAIPTQLISNAIAPVYLQKANTLFLQDISLLKKFTAKLIRYSQLMLIIPFSVLIVFSDILIAFFLGDKWQSTSVIVSITGVYLFFELVINPISSVFQLLKKERNILFINILSLGLTSLFLMLSAFFDLGFYWTLGLFTFSRLVISFIQSFLICSYLQLSFFRNIGVFYLLFPGVVMLFYFLKTLI